MQNKVQLITYVDRLSAGGLPGLAALLQGPLAGLFGGVHLLPFFHPIDGADAGFDPIDHRQVDPRLGDWRDVERLSQHVDVMADVIVNHMSSRSPQFQDYLRSGPSSAYRGLFLTRDRVFPGGATPTELAAIYRPRPGAPFTELQRADGANETFWTTFTREQIDIDVLSPPGKEYLEQILQTFAASGVRMIRLDAVGYAIKKRGTSCFMLPETFDLISGLRARARQLGIEVLVEIHSYYRQQIEIAAQVDWVYDFALPPLVLHAFAFGTARALKEWIAIRPRNAVTVLDTHDGIGIVDIGADPGDRESRPGLVPPGELDALVESIHRNSGGQSRQATGAAASNLDLYQVNCTYYDALARDDRRYLAARAVQFFLPGIPQVYYVGLLAGINDMALLARSGVGRDINRHHYSAEELAAALDRPVVRELLALIRLRNAHPAFGGSFSVEPTADAALRLRWQRGAERAQLDVDFRSGDYRVTLNP